MNKTRLALFLCTLLATGAAYAEDKKDTDSPETLIATVNGKPYRLDLFRVFIMERLQGRPTNNNPAVQQQLFDEFMNLIVASQEGERRHLEGERNVVAALELERMKVMSNAALSAMANEIEPSEKELKEAYDRVKEQSTRTEYKARHILLKSEDEAKKLIKQLDKGAKFEELAKKHSEGPTAKDGGDLGWFDPAQMVPPFAAAVTALKPGSYTKEPVQTQFGWHIVKLEETRQAEPPSFEEAKPQLTALVKRQKLGERLTDMRNNAMVELNEDVVRVTKIEGEDAKKD
ncbi:peptidylprolyl isomerase [Thermochromatium tepidum]|uniref:peptidylprolyl isomerase n=1 Tax=Thermochromatium tepidum ATCC 43061 TaxID=316276 RepID=A0A6I6E557_THETI|nr:peptidylprolyl isomerase [Thermochromatium tepidum]QGU31578.1 peptidylprolyl isomerase [Thermochromatium tepidum ATCC 43061]